MNNLEKKRYWIWLSLIKGLGSKKKQKLLEKYKTPEKIYQIKQEKLLKIPGIGKEVAKNIENIQTRNEVHKHIAYMKQNNIANL